MGNTVETKNMGGVKFRILCVLHVFDEEEEEEVERRRRGATNSVATFCVFLIPHAIIVIVRTL